MGWLRRERDCIALVVVWALLVQAAILSFASAAHAATLASGQAIVLCTAKGAVISLELPGQSHQKADCQCCAMSCRQACGTSAGLVPLALHVPLPADRGLGQPAAAIRAGRPRTRQITGPTPRPSPRLGSD